MSEKNDPTAACRRAAEAIHAADALLIGAGAGMGVDSGLPDFRGPQGFWRAYPVFQGRRFEEISNPVWFRTDPEQAWGFFGHRLNLYRAAAPHAGFEIRRRWCQRCPQGHFVFTSNVDGHARHATAIGPDAARLRGCRASSWPRDHQHKARDQTCQRRAVGPVPSTSGVRLQLVLHNRIP